MVQDACDIMEGGDASIIGRNVFRRPRAEAIAPLNQVVKTYQGL